MNAEAEVPALAAEALTLERTLSGLVNQAYALIPAEIALRWHPARMPILPPATSFRGCGMWTRCVALSRELHAALAPPG